MTLKHEPLGLVSVQYPTGEEWRNNSKKKKKKLKRLKQSGNIAQLWMPDVIVRCYKEQY